MNDDYIIKLEHQIVLFRNSLENEGANIDFINYICDAYIRNLLLVASIS